MLVSPVVLFFNENLPIAILPKPVVLLVRVSVPIARFEGSVSAKSM
jgi:hypothetical protein